MEKRMKRIILGNGSDWLKICYGDTDDYSYLFNNTMPIKSEKVLINLITKILYSHKLFKFFHHRCCFRKLLFKYSQFSGIIDPNEEVFFIFYDHNKLAVDDQYLKWLRKKFVRCKLVYVFTNIVSKSGAYDWDFIKKLNIAYDLTYTFQKADAIKYNFRYHYLVFSPSISPNSDEKKSNEIYDCLFVGKAKDRIETLHNVYKKLVELNMRPCFYITGVKKEERLIDSDIVYNQVISYEDVLKLVSKSKCILDIMQSGSTGITLRCLESVFFNKKLITNNPLIMEDKCFRNNTLYMSSINDISKEFIFSENKIDENYSSLFSVKEFFDCLQKDLYNCQK